MPVMKTYEPKMMAAVRLPATLTEAGAARLGVPRGPVMVTKPNADGVCGAVYSMAGDYLGGVLSTVGDDPSAILDAEGS